MNDVKGLRANYDDIADVLYLSKGHATPDRYEEDESGLIWRIAKNGELYGVTIMDYMEYWSGRREQLAARIAIILHVPADVTALTLSRIH